MQVEVILNTKVEGLGAEADLVKVRPGYARNFLFPQGMAAPATSASKKQVELLKKKRAEREAKELNDAQEYAGKLSKVKLTFVLTAGTQDKVFGSVTAQDIANRLKEQGHEVDKRKIELARGIKDLGEHEVVIKLHSDITAKITVITESPAKEEAPVRPAKKPRGKADAEEAPKAEKKSKKSDKKSE